MRWLSMLSETTYAAAAKARSTAAPSPACHSKHRLPGTSDDRSGAPAACAAAPVVTAGSGMYSTMIFSAASSA
jgi:hypothetical protein